MEIVKDYLLLLAGTFLTALAFNFFLVPHRIAPGGFSGIAKVVYNVFHVPVGITMLLLNVPVFIIGVKKMGGDFGLKTVISTILLSAFIDLVRVPSITGDSILASIYGGVLMGLGLGLCSGQCYNRGTDLLAKIIHNSLPIYWCRMILFTVDFWWYLQRPWYSGPVRHYMLWCLYILAPVLWILSLRG